MFQIKLDDLTGKAIFQLLQEHLDDMQATSPPESKHALNLDDLKAPSIKFWTIWKGDKLAGCGAFKHLNNDVVEVKSMRTANDFRGNGVASILLKHIIEQAKNSGYKEIYLETGSMDYFKPAHQLYKKHGFKICRPFANYKEDINSIFMFLTINPK